MIKVPLDLPLDAPLEDEEERAAESIDEAKALGADHGVEVAGTSSASRSIGDAIVKEARATERGPDRPRLRAALAAAVAVLLADGRLRAQEGAVLRC